MADILAKYKKNPKLILERDNDLKADKAYYYVQDAFAGRLKHGLAAVSKREKWIKRIFEIQVSKRWLSAVCFANILHCILGLEMTRRNIVVMSVEVMCLIIYCCDIIFKIIYMGWADYRDKSWQRWYIFTICCLILEKLSKPFRFCKFLRPGVTCLRSRAIRRFYTVIQAMTPGFLTVCIPVIFFLSLATAVAPMAFGHLLPNELGSIDNASSNLW